MTTKYTPGPWQVCLDNNGQLREVKAIDGCATVAKVNPVLSGDLANAKLIAAAPDLLAALIEMCEGWPAQKPGSPHFDTYCKARQAIEKATK